MSNIMGLIAQLQSNCIWTTMQLIKTVAWKCPIKKFMLFPWMEKEALKSIRMNG